MLTNGEKELFAALMALRAETVDLVSVNIEGRQYVLARSPCRKRVERQVDKLIQKVSATLTTTKG